MINRKQDWPSLLADYIEKCRKENFKWGTLDCCLFTAGAVNAITGKDYSIDFIGKYNSRKEAILLLSGLDFNSVVDLVDSLLPRVNRLGRGDVVCKEFEEGSTLGICLGDKDCFVNKDGLIFIKAELSKLSIRWKV